MPHCYAKNHRWNCECGFGMAKRSRQPKDRAADDSDLFFVPRVPRRYTKPNERCPFCDAPVFFRRLANGGRVYFDEPGSPWPKHPCTDPVSESYLGPFGRKRKGWPQVVDISVEAASSSTFRLLGKIDEKDWSALVSTGAFGDAPISARYITSSFIQAQPGTDGAFDLALLGPDLRKFLVRANTS